jgi:long-chain-fatty-acid--CoA ligase ACSBG
MIGVGAAPITLETLEYFGSLDIPLCELYGMSESSGVTTISHPNRYVWGSCGCAMPGVQVKVFHVDPDTGAKKECPRAQDFFQPTGAEQGEICFRGRHIMLGYLANPDMGEAHVAELEQKTREAIDDDGWLHSGDMGCMDVNGMIRITGRYKELIIGAGGENIAPVPIEDEIKKHCSAISNVMMVGDKRKFNTCLVTLKAKGATGEQPGGDELDGPAASLVAGITTISGAKASKEYRAEIEKAIKGTNDNSVVCPSQASRIQKFEILDQDFSCQGGELTPTLKLKRTVACDIHRTVIDKLYGESTL